MKIAFFDLDGTLTDTRDDLTLAINLTRADYGLPPVCRETVVAAIGNGVRPLIERIFDPLPDDYATILRLYRQHYEEHLLDNTVFYPGVERTLIGLREAGWRLGVVTNKPSHFATPILSGLDADHFFGAIVGGGDCETLKPDPELVFLAAERMGVTLDGGDWMIGDHVTDLKAGGNAGVKTCFCEFGMGQTHGAPYDAAIARMEEFLELAL